MAATTEEILAELDANNGRIRRAFMAVIRAILGAVAVGEVGRLLAAGRYTEVMAAIGLNSTRLSPVVDAIREAFKSAGELEAKNIRSPGTKLRMQFDMRNPAAERWLRTQSAEMVTRITEDQRAALRTVLEAGMRAGQNPRRVALDIVGRIDKVTGRRIGGVIGMNEQLTTFAQNARAELLSGESADMANYLTRILRDRRFDGVVRKAMTAGEPVPINEVDAAIARYGDRLLNLRGEMIARTEGLAALNSAREIAYQQAIDEGTIDPKNITKVWDTAHDGRVRDMHRAMSGKTVQGIDGVFVAPDGSRLRYPGDRSMGASAAMVINCRCVQKVKVNFIAQNLERAA